MSFKCKLIWQSLLTMDASMPGLGQLSTGVSVWLGQVSTGPDWFGLRSVGPDWPHSITCEHLSSKFVGLCSESFSSQSDSDVLQDSELLIKIRGSSLHQNLKPCNVEAFLLQYWDERRRNWLFKQGSEWKLYRYRYDYRELGRDKMFPGQNVLG